MSRFLGPIHHWLFNKIKLYEELETDIIENAKKGLEGSIENQISSIRDEIGHPIPDKPLEEVIDTNNIHGWLQERITVAETRQAAIITYLIEKFDSKALEIIKDAYSKQGTKTGIDARNNYEVETADQLYKALNNYILDGMPCDNVNNITINSEERLQWKVMNCLHKGYWNKVDGDINVLYDLREIWITNFIENANPKFKYQFNIEENNGQKILVHEINK